MSNSPLNILLVEDDEVDVMNVKRAFDKNHITNPLFVAGNGLEALEKLRSGEVPQSRRIVLLDLNMPRMNGIEFLRAACETIPRSPRRLWSFSPHLIMIATRSTPSISTWPVIW